ncbi:protein spire homolog 1-like [Physella acuta]|uniref:protein spire homolog 1-like n=1 Tax=Physella acuta TaxID=109671 RepID=UPI0027DBD33B|nr:protein spire homolog 1-like [Physella acuta]
MELLPFVDILKVFNNPINEEQAWAVCYQCALFLSRNTPQQQEYFQDIYDSGIHSIWLSRHGDVFLRKGPTDPNGSGKGPPSYQNQPHITSPSSSYAVCKKRGRVIATETDAVQALGTSIFEALDYGIDPADERQLSHELESLIATMTNADTSLESQNADDEGIEKDADLDHRCSIQDVLQICKRHLSSKQDAQHHYKAVCRALATEAGELFTFLEKISTHKERLTEDQNEDTMRLDELQRADWACLWVQVTRSLRQGVRLKKVEHVNLQPLEYELTPFEMLLEDIRSRRYTLNKITTNNGELPHKVKNDAHAFILDFIRSRPPLKKVDERKLNPKPPSPPDPYENLLKEIRARPKLKPVKGGKLLVETSGSILNDDLEHPVKRVIKPDLNLLKDNSFEESSDDDESSRCSLTGSLPQLSPTMTPPISWQRAVTKDVLLRDSSNARPNRLQRRHTIMVCESALEGKVSLQELPPLEEEEEPSPVRESHFSHDFSLHGQLTRTCVSEHDLTSQRNSRKSSLEHRRSLTSLPTGLSVIPEDVGPESPPKQLPSRKKSWSQEHAPPPNPSPPCKGRARSAMGRQISHSPLISSACLTSTSMSVPVFNPHPIRQDKSQSALDVGASSQSPHYSPMANQSKVSQAARWRQPRAREDRLASKKQVNPIPDEIAQPIPETEEDVLYRRLSLDSQASIYTTPKGVLTRPTRSSLDEERISRWRTLQEEELSSRKSNSTQKQSTDSEDALQLRLKAEEARLDRWRTLEQPGWSREKTKLRMDVGEPEPANKKETPSTQSLKKIPVLHDPKKHSNITLPKDWQNPVECLSLTLEEVTHIREVLTKAELESLISHPELYQQVSKNKLCFTCKTSRFTLFGEWGTKCKLCKRTVCSKCVRKMNIPTDHFRNIPVYTLSPAPLSLETEEFIQNMIRNPPPCSVPPTRDTSPSRKHIIPSLDDHHSQDPKSETCLAQFDVTNIRTIERSQSVLVPGHKSTKTTMKGPLMAICCDCKGMVTEIIRASRSSLAKLSASHTSAGNCKPKSGL